MQNIVNIEKKARTFTLALVDNDDTLIDKNANINTHLLNHLRNQVKPDYLAIITGRILGTVANINLNPHSSSFFRRKISRWKNQLAFDEVYQGLANSEDSENPPLKIDFVSTPYDLAHVKEDDWKGFYQTKMKPFENAVKNDTKITSIEQARRYWKHNASKLQSSDEEKCLEILTDADLSKTKYAEIVNAFKVNDDVKNELIKSHPANKPLANKHLQTLDFLRKLAKTKSLDKKNYDELEIAIYDDNTENIQAMKNAAGDFNKLTGIRLKFFTANIKYGEGNNMFSQTQNVCAKLTTKLDSYRRFYMALSYKVSSNSRAENNLFYRLKNNFRDKSSRSHDLVSGEHEGYQGHNSQSFQLPTTPPSNQ
ncbi:hypothetical protein LBMAG18_01800 [Alphaproteobacteria bacterium]|nr:hypothetical protein LBMAG18_01800 [Alphaproteobacteria bacterium]